MPGLGASFGFGACTNFPRDLLNSDCILIMGSNMAESHPVAFQWVMEAKERGAVLIHVDPRFTRTSAVADLAVRIRPGTDLAFLGAIIHVILREEAYFTDFIVPYTNAATLVSPNFARCDASGLFVGFNPASGAYDQQPEAWDYELDSAGVPRSDPGLCHPRCVLRVLEKHFARYSPQAVAAICGCAAEDILRVAHVLMANSGRERTSAVAYALGWTQHATGPQIIRAAGIVQLLLGNVGRPGSGVIALRGHSNVQGATDLPTLNSSLPNYLPQPTVDPAYDSLKSLFAAGHGLSARRGGASGGLWEKERTQGAWAAFPKYMVSLLKAWYGTAATPENEFCYRNLPRLDGNQSEQSYFVHMLHDEVAGLFLFGENPALSSPNASVHRAALRRLKWLVLIDAFETESASAWYADPNGPDPRSVETEVFLLPAALALEKDGSVTNTERLVQWHDGVLPPPGEAKSDLWYLDALCRRLKGLYAGSSLERDRPIQELTWDYAPDWDAAPAVESQPSSLAESALAREADAEKVLREINGYRVADGTQLASPSELAADGSTACGGRLYCGIFPRPGENLAKRKGKSAETDSLYPQWAWTWPGNTRILYNRAAADPQGRPWSERKKLVWWDAAAKQWTGLDTPHFELNKAPDYRPLPEATGMGAIAGDAPFSVHFDGKAWLYAPFGLSDGPLPVYYEPLESPVKNCLYERQLSPRTLVLKDALNPVAEPGDPAYPHVLTTYRLTEHFLSGVMTRSDPWLAELQPELFIEIDPDLAAEYGLGQLDWVQVESPRGAIEGRVLISHRLRPVEACGRKLHVVGVPMHFGYLGGIVGASANELSPISLGFDSDIASVKSFSCRLRPGRLREGLPEQAGLSARLADKAKWAKRAKGAKGARPFASLTLGIRSVPWIEAPEGRLDDVCTK